MSSSDWLGRSDWHAIWPGGVDRVILDETDSTMAEAARRAPPKRPVWIMAERQTAARGRRGRAWAMPAGNLAATYLCRPERTAQEAALMSFAAGLAVCDALSRWVPAEQLSLKWPNDVLLRGRKLGGILLESSGAGERLDWLSIGIGLNIAAAPAPDQVEPGAVPPIALADVLPWPRQADDPAQELQLLLAHIASSFASVLRVWEGSGFDILRNIWLSKAERLGETVTARMPRETVAGVFQEIDTDGCLILSTDRGTRRIAAADVYF